MRIAVCYSGGLRTFKKCYEENHNILSAHGEVDYFISTWEKPCYTKVDRYNDIHAIGGDTIYEDMLKADDYITKEYLNSLLPFKKVMIESMDVMQTIIDSCKDLPWHIMSPSRLLCQYYMMNSANSWKNLYASENNIKYDMTIRLRPDVVIGDFPKELDLSKIYLNSVVYRDTPTNLADIINEMIYISNDEHMDKICKIFENFRNLWSIDRGYGERVSRNNLRHMRLLRHCDLFDFKLKVIRENGNDEFIR